MLFAALTATACGPAPQGPAIRTVAAPAPQRTAIRAIVAPAPPGAPPVVLQRCDDGGDGGVLINGICV